ncbi:CHASE domain-containing protein [Sulfitobacter sp. HNIBRBA3233]|uniref:CHASE domain-containing protein n=1 Tax=Sulfitobacter marinivivus TaxID=3158558 RepID=UPI0032E01EE1
MASANHQFRQIASENKSSIEMRLGDYSAVLASVATYLSVTETVSLRDYNEFIGGLNIEERYEGIRGISFVRAVSDAGIPFLEKGLSAEYERDIRVHPNTGNSERFILSRISPLAGNEAAIGLDLTFEEGRRRTLNEARATGEVMMSPRIALVQDEKQQIGFILVLAAYESGSPAFGADDDTGDFLGWVNAPFVAKELFTVASSAAAPNYHLRVYDREDMRSDALVYDNAPSLPHDGIFSQKFSLMINGQPLFLSYSSTPFFDGSVISYVPYLLALLGISIAALVAVIFKYSDLRSTALKEIAETRARQLGAREEENRSLLETTLSAVMILDGDGRIKISNEAANEMFVASHETLDGRDFGDLVSLKPGRQRKDGFNAEGTGPEGERLFLDVETNSWKSADGESRITAIVRDVTETIKARNEVDAVRRRYDLALGGAEIGIFEIDLSTGKSVVSETWHKIMGTEMIKEHFDHQEHFMSRVHPEDLPALLEADRRCIEGETARTMAEYRIRFGEEWRWMYSDAIAIERDERGHGTRLVGTQSDITEIHRARNALELSEERFRLVLADAPVGMALLDGAGNFKDANIALEKLCGYRKEQLLEDMKISDLVSEADFKKIHDDVAVMLKERKKTAYSTQAMLKSRSGEVRWGLINVSWTFDKNIGENVFIAQIVDISDQKKVEQIKSEFVATVSHELRTPLTSIKGALGLFSATEARNLGDAAARLIQIARVNADRLSMIVNDILDLEKISSGEVVFEIQNTSLGEIVTSSVSEMHPFAVQHHNTLEVEAPDGDLVVHIDANRTRQVLANLISNGCKYSDPDTPVVVRYERLATEAIIFVRNLGPGIPESFREKIFDAFTQLDGSDTRSKGGTGLGLNITRQIVARQSGRIGFESTPDGLTVFWFTVPLVNVDAILSREETAKKTTPRKKTLRVLHVEDDPDFAEVIRAGVGDMADFAHAPSLAVARRQIDAREWDIVLIDWSLPDGDGHALLDQIEADHPDTRVIVLSAANKEADHPKVELTLTKSQVEIEEIVELIRASSEGDAGSTKSFSG